MCELPVDGFHYGMTLVPDINNFVHVFRLKHVQCLKNTIPTRIPVLHHLSPCEIALTKFFIPFPEWFFTIGIKKICKPGKHISAQVFYYNCNAVAVFIELPV